jgi:hypothetical protein
MTDAGLTAYVEAVERRLTTRRGRVHVLAPPDFALVRTWYREGVPLPRLLDAIDRAAQDGDALTSLAALRAGLASHTRI